jgi:arylsulfatase A-like enzyme
MALSEQPSACLPALNDVTAKWLQFIARPVREIVGSEAFDCVVKTRVAEILSRWRDFLAGDDIGLGGPPIAVARVLLLCLMATLLFGWVPSQGTGAGAFVSSFVHAMPAADSAARPEEDDRPNIVVIYLDDMRASDLNIMHNVNNLIAAKGVTFTDSAVTTSACCPARATHLSGQYAHNTGVMHNSPPYGGYMTFKFGKQAAGESLPIWLASAGYRTMFLGKFMNHYPDQWDPFDVPSGFTDWYGLYEGPLRGIDYTIYRQTRYVVRVKTSGDRPVIDQELARQVIPVAPHDGDGHMFMYEGEDRHQTAVFMNGAVQAIERDNGSRPLYLNVWLTSPHAGGDGSIVGGKNYREKLRSLTTRPEQPELAQLRWLLNRGQGLGEFALDRPASFNEVDVADKPQFIRQKPKLSREDVKDIEIRNALRLAALKSVDRRIPELLAALERAERRTGRESYVVFSSDGGFFLGEHRLPYEKNWHYGAATDVPLVISGPGVSQNAEISAPVANIDLAPTLMQMAGAGDGVTAAIDGRSLVPLLEHPSVADTSWWKQRAVLLEGFWGNSRRRRYSGVRTNTHVYVEHYAHEDGKTREFRELYDRQADPGYRRNLLHGRVSPESQRVAWRLATLLDRLRMCSGRQCHEADDITGIDLPQRSAPPTSANPRRGGVSEGPRDPAEGARPRRSPSPYSSSDR